MKNRTWEKRYRKLYEKAQLMFLENTALKRENEILIAKLNPDTFEAKNEGEDSNGVSSNEPASTSGV